MSVSQIKTWFRKAVPAPTQKNLNTQIGCHLEEMGELLVELKPNSEPDAEMEFATLQEVIPLWADALKKGRLQLDVPEKNRVAVLDALCDSIVTAIGIAHMLGMDIEGALKEVADSNDSKFDAHGRPIFDKNHKIKKSELYREPVLDRFV